MLNDEPVPIRYYARNLVNQVCAPLDVQPTLFKHPNLIKILGSWSDKESNSNTNFEITAGTSILLYL